MNIIAAIDDRCVKAQKLCKHNTFAISAQKYMKLTNYFLTISKMNLTFQCNRHLAIVDILAIVI